MRHYFQDKSTNLSKRERTRSALVDGAIAAIARHGLQGTSIKEITNVAGLSNGTFYNHFDDRDGVLKLAAISVAREISDDIADAVKGEPDGLARIIRSTQLFIERATTAPDWGALIVDTAHHLGSVRHDVAKNLRADIQRAIDQGTLDHMPSRFVIDQIGALIALAIETQLHRGKSKAVTRQTCDAVLRLLGLPPEKAQSAVKRVTG